jgi:hypothetical protein
MPAYRKFVAAVFLLTVNSWLDTTLVKADTLGTASSKTPRAVVTHWLELHRTGNRDEASALTTGSRFHRADVLLSPKRDEGVRVARSLDNGRAAAVVTTSPDEAGDGQQVLLFWLVRRDGVWRINKSDMENKQIVDERLRGFLESGDVRWDVQRDQLLGRWEAGAGDPPIIVGVECGSRLQLGNDNRYQLYAWGPFPPANDFDADNVLRGVWRLADDRILMSHQGQTDESRIVWLADHLLVLESADGSGSAKYKRKHVISDSDKGK